MMTGFHLLLAVVALTTALCVVMTGAWLVQQRTGNSGWVDTIWTFGLGSVGGLAALAPFTQVSARQVIVAVLAACWSLRLGLHIAQRSRGIVDDPRYAEMAKGWGADAKRQMFWLLQKQAWVSVPLALGIFLAAHHPAAGLRLQDALGVLVLAIAIGGEALADRQLRAFRQDPAHRGKVCDVGLWSWSRHPNYFFEWFGWLAYPLIAIDVSFAYPWGWLSLLAPLCMYWLLVYVSGIPPLEKHMLQSRGPAFRAYQARTSAFFPLPPRSRT